VRKKYFASFTYEELYLDGERAWRFGDGVYEVEGPGLDLLVLKYMIRQDLRTRNHNNVAFLVLLNYKRLVDTSPIET